MKRKDKSGGRPRIEEGDKKKAVISFRTDKITRRHLEKLQNKADKSISEVLREAVKNSVIEKSVYTDYLNGKVSLTKADLLGMLVISSYVMEALPKELINIIKNLYKVTIDINAIVKRLNYLDCDELQRDYYTLSSQVSQINHELTTFIQNYRSGKEVQP